MKLGYTCANCFEDVHSDPSVSPSNGRLLRLYSTSPYYIEMEIGMSESVSDAPLFLNPFSSNTMFQGREDLWRTYSPKTLTNSSEWTKISDLTVNFFNGHNYNTIYSSDISGSDSNTIIVSYVRGDSWNIEFNNCKLLKTTRGGGLGASDWVDITPNPINPYLITDIASSSWNPNHIWVCYSGYYPSYKVKRTTDGGLTWSSFSEGLPNLPINCIVYVNGSNDALFVGTDVGVYYRDNTMTQWEPFMTNLPNVIVNWLEINYSKGYLRAATYGRGLWESPLPCLPSAAVHQITSTKTIYSPQRFTTNISVEQGVTLTIKSKVTFNPNVRLIVKPGAQLIIDGGELTSSCDAYWAGIEVWGSTYLSQSPTSNQGKVELINGASVKNATIGILIGKRLDQDFNRFDAPYGGGLVWCTDGHFINNKVDVLFIPYNNINHSFFNTSEFLTDAPLIASERPDSHVKIYGTNEVEFRGCSFTNSRGWNDCSIDERGTGIYADNSKVIIKEKCISADDPCTNLVPSLFEKLSRGVYAMNNGSINNLDITNTNFYDNVKGLYLSGYSGVSNSTVTKCNFRVYRPGEIVVDCYGMYLDACSGYVTEENNFYSVGTICDGIGLIVNNSVCSDATEVNRIYRNTFTNLQYGSLAQNANRNSKTKEGLCYKCNKFFDNYTDIAVTKDPAIPTNPSLGIAENQGTNNGLLTGPANNMFDITPLTSHYDLDNRLILFNYFYLSSNGTGQYRMYPDYRNGLITLYPVNGIFDEERCCPPTNNNGGGSGESEESLLMIESCGKSDSIEGILTSLTDEGSTESLKEEVLSSTPLDALSLHQELIDASPYISDTVVKATIEKETVFTNSMVRDVMVANTHSAKSDTLITMLENRANPMPGYMIDEIMKGIDSISGKEDLEAQVAYWNIENSIHYHNLLRHSRTDSVSESLNDTLVTLLQNRNTIESMFDLTALYFQHGYYESALNTLNLVPAMFSFDNIQQEQYSAIVQFFNILKKVIMDTSYVLRIDSTDIGTLLLMTDMNCPYVSPWSRNLLLASGNLSYLEPIYLPLDDLKSSKFIEKKSNGPWNETNLLKAFPNPAKNYVTVEYNISCVIKDCKLELSEISGKKIKSIPIQDQQNQMIISLKGLDSGVYFISLINNGKAIETEKVIIKD